MKLHKRVKRNQSGITIAEGAAVMVFGIPLLAVLLFLATELAHFYTIKSAMEVGARNAARGLVVAYNNSGSSKTEKTTVDFITVPNYIADSNQFTVQWDSATNPTNVTVTCTYPSDGSYGLRKFPWGPLWYLTNNSAFNMSGITVKGTFTMPVQ